MSEQPKCDICNKHDASLICPNPDCDVNNICFVCSKSFNKEGKYANKTEDAVSSCCPKCDTPLIS